MCVCFNAAYSSHQRGAVSCIVSTSEHAASLCYRSKGREKNGKFIFQSVSKKLISPAEWNPRSWQADLWNVRSPKLVHSFNSIIILLPTMQLLSSKWSIHAAPCDWNGIKEEGERALHPHANFLSCSKGSSSLAENK